MSFNRALRPFTTVPIVAAVLSGALLVSAGAVRAAGELPFYDVEVVVFENVGAADMGETWPPTVGLELPEQVVSFADEEAERAAEELGFRALTPEEARLTPVVDSLNLSSRYRVIAYRGWRQPGLPEGSAISVHIHGGKDYTGLYPPPLTLDDLAPTLVAEPLPLPLPVTTPEETDEQVIEELDGTVTVVLQRYLHLYTDLAFRAPETRTQQLEASEGGEVVEGGSFLRSFPMRDQRRMRSRELHFLDHPRFGLIALVTPYEPGRDIDLDTGTGEPVASGDGG